jgi:hypothetical protein
VGWVVVKVKPELPVDKLIKIALLHIGHMVVRDQRQRIVGAEQPRPASKVPPSGTSGTGPPASGLHVLHVGLDADLA